jgi:hypothetical protein
MEGIIAQIDDPGQRNRGGQIYGDDARRYFFPATELIGAEIHKDLRGRRVTFNVEANDARAVRLL